MLRDRYAPQDLFALVPEAALAFDPVLARLDVLLDDDDLYQRVRADLATRYPRTAPRGRPSTPVEVILRLLLVRRLYGWSYAEVERFVSDSLVLRQFCRVYLRPVPDGTTLIRWAALVGPDTVAALNDRVVALAQQARVTRGRRLRIDAHRERFGHPPDLVAGDRGLYSPENETRAQERGVRRVALPKAGLASPTRQRHERERWFRRGFRFRAGLEGRIHVLRRDDGLDRCRDHGADGFGRWVGWGIVAHNLTQIAREQAATTGRTARPTRRAA